MPEPDTNVGTTIARQAEEVTNFISMWTGDMGPKNPAALADQFRSVEIRAGVL